MKNFKSVLLTEPFSNLQRRDDEFLFPDSPAPTINGDLVALLVKTISGIDVDGHRDKDGIIPAGYTYLGQFIAHDFVPARTNSRKVLPRLFLDSLYSDAPGKSPWFDDQGRFIMGEPVAALDCAVIDVPRDDKCVAKIPESRNDENVIVAQVHVLFQKIHNEIIDLLPKKYLLKKREDRIEAARMVTVYVFHRIVLDDYLPRILAPEILDYLVHRRERFLLNGALVAVPREFSMAAFRFGHSMVRQRYQLNRVNSFPLDDLLQQNHAIGANFALNWDLLFGNAGHQPSNAIDTELAVGLTRVDTGNGTMNLAELNIRASLGVTTGRAIVDHLKAQLSGHEILFKGLAAAITPDEISKHLNIPKINENNLPLWVYVLIEAKEKGEGKHLGLVASLIVGEVLLAAIRGAPFNALRSWRSTRLALPNVALDLVNQIAYEVGSFSIQRLTRLFPSTIVRE